MSHVPDGPLLTEAEFDRLVGIVPELTALQLWNIADTFGRRIVALPEGGGKGGTSTTSRSRQDRGELRVGFRA